MIEALFNFVLDLVGGFVLQILFYWPGWLVLKILTLGRYPPPRPRPHNEMAVGAFGFGACLCAVVALLVLRSSA